MKKREPIILFALIHLFGHLFGGLAPFLMSSNAQAFTFQECGVWQVHGQFSKAHQTSKENKTSKEGDSLVFVLNKGTDSQYNVRIRNLNLKIGMKMFPLDVPQDITLMFTKSCYYSCEAEIVHDRTPAVSTPKKVKSLKCTGAIEFKKDEQ